MARIESSSISPRDAQIAAGYALDDELNLGTAAADAAAARKRASAGGDNGIFDAIKQEVDRNPVTVLELGRDVAIALATEKLHPGTVVRLRLAAAAERRRQIGKPLRPRK
jgi:hypothetical protein